MSKCSLLIIFYRNPELGKVKTRLAKAIGDEMALAIYLKLSSYTHHITEDLSVNKVVCYSQFADTEDHWPNRSYQKKVQQGNDLGERMHNAFAQAFAEGYRSVCIIGTDCLELTSSIIKDAFKKLITYDVVIGPAADGGYYLLGMNKHYPEVFKNKSWSTATVSRDTILDFINLKLRFSELQTLSDIDDEKDLLQSGKLF
ncbi:MAG: TIGR04282 family arsenosugar biosynthesis glycosyltransferase [Bacteroidota bacterium]